jgi:hypothetical protein
VTKAAAEFVARRGGDDTTPLDAAALDQEIRICEFCLRGESPGTALTKRVMNAVAGKRGVKKITQLIHKDDEDNVLNTLGQVVSEMGLGEQQDAHMTPVPLVRGSKADMDFGTDSVAPRSGHFEFLNKTKYMVAVKLTSFIRSGQEMGDIIDDIARPYYIAVPPGESVRAEFEHTKIDESLVIHVLYEHPYPFVKTGLVTDTKKVKSLDQISACANITHFERACSWRVNAVHKNCILKLKPATSVAAGADTGGLELVPRKGTAVARVGLVNWMTSKSTVEDQNSIDFETNCVMCKHVVSV